jgi:hypothetical protein
MAGSTIVAASSKAALAGIADLLVKVMPRSFNSTLTRSGSWAFWGNTMHVACQTQN